MTTSRLTTLFVVLLAGLSCVFLIPEQLDSQPVGIEMDLPEYIGEWFGTNLKVSEGEIYTLGPGTDFARKSYTNGRGDQLQVSIVLSGQDMNTSIHRPERCLPAQGWTVTDKGSRVIVIPGQQPVPTTRLHNLRNIQGPEGKLVPLYNLNYYWFVGHTDVTGSHVERTLIDVKDRLLKGSNQRWAYVTVAGSITKNFQKFGHDEKETDEFIQNFIRLIVPKIHKNAAPRS